MMRIVLRVLGVLFGLCAIYSGFALLFASHEFLTRDGIRGIWEFATFAFTFFGGFVAAAWLFSLNQRGLPLAAALFANYLLLMVTTPFSGERYSAASLVVIAAIDVAGIALVLSPAARKACNGARSIANQA